MKRYQPIEMLVIPAENKDVLTLSNAGQLLVEEDPAVLNWAQSQFE